MWHQPARQCPNSKPFAQRRFALIIVSFAAVNHTFSKAWLVNQACDTRNPWPIEVHLACSIFERRKTSKRYGKLVQSTRDTTTYLMGHHHGTLWQRFGNLITEATEGTGDENPVSNIVTNHIIVDQINPAFVGILFRLGRFVGVVSFVCANARITYLRPRCIAPFETEESAGFGSKDTSSRSLPAYMSKT